MWTLDCTSVDRALRMFSALAAETGDGTVGEVRLEAVASLQFVGERLEHIQRELRFRAASAADHMVVSGRVGALVLRYTVMKMGVPYGTQLLQDFKCAIDSGDVDVGERAHDLLMDLVGREMSMGCRDNVEDELALWCHAQSALSKCELQVGRLDHTVSRAAPYHSSMSRSPSDESADVPQKGEVLKASAPGPRQVRVGMEVAALDGERIGTVKEVRGEEFLLSRHLARSLWVPLSAVLAAEDYTGNYRGPVQETTIVLEISAAHVDRQGWRHG